MTKIGILKSDIIFADSAEPKSIQELKDLGFKNVIGAIKGPDSLLHGIKEIQSLEVFVTENSNNLWTDNQEYKWVEDKATTAPDGGHGFTNEPTGPDHLKDAVRYGRNTKKKRGLGEGGIKKLN